MNRIHFLLGALALVLSFALLKPIRTGDALEYVYTLQAWSQHGTPDLRPNDQERVAFFLRLNDIEDTCPGSGFFEARTGQRFCWHFWMYPLTGVPAKFLLRLAHCNQLAALQVTNVLFFVLALYLALCSKYSNPHTRWTLVGLAAVGPVLWYLRWMSPEAFTWSCVLISLVFLSNRRYPVAAVWAALGAMQNPPVLFLALYIAVLSWRERNLRLALGTAAAACLSFVPNVFYLAYYGKPNLIVATGATDFSLVSWSRTWSFLADLNQGMLPYVPLLLVLTGVAFVYVLRARSLVGLGMVAVLGLMIAACESQTNWNGGAAGMMRYAVWIVPICAWLVAEYVPPCALLRTCVIAAVAIQTAIVIHHAGEETNLMQTRLAINVMEKLPELYNPEPQIFFNRQLGRDGNAADYLPIPFVARNGRVTKLLLDSASLARLPERFVVDPGYHERVLREFQGRSGLFYLNPPRGAVILPPCGPLPTEEDVTAAVQIELGEFPAASDAPLLALSVRITNEGDAEFLDRKNVCHNPLIVTSRILENDRVVVFQGRRAYPSQPLRPGDTVTLPVVVELPQREGQFVVEVFPALECYVSGQRPARLLVNVLEASASGYRAELRTR